MGLTCRNCRLTPVPLFMLLLMSGEFGYLLLTGQKVLPQRLLDAGFSFSFPSIEAALADLLGQGAKE